MRYRQDQKDEARARLLAAAGRGFRRQGYGGIGVDGLAREAGVTSGAFYGHFRSKDAAFAEAAVSGLEELRQAVAGFQLSHEDRWAEAFIDFYLGERLACGLDEACGLQSLTPDVMRADRATRARYQAELERVAEQIASGLAGGDAAARRGKAWALMALLSGGATIARSLATDETRLAVADQMRGSARPLLADGAG